MAYLGNTPTTQTFVSGTDYFNGTGSQTAFTLSRTVASINDIQVTVNNVVQQPNDAYTISGTTLTMTSAPSAGTNNVYVRYLSTTTQAITPSQNTVSWNTLDTNTQNDLGLMYKNKLINGSFDIWQRGTSIASSGATYTADRWYLLRDSNASGSTCSQVTATNPIFSYGAKVQRDSGNSGTQNLYFAQPFETQNITSLRGNYVAVSFYVKAGANFSGSNLKVYLVSGTGTNAKYWGGGFTSATTLINGTAISITTTQSYQTLITSAAVPTNATQLELSFVYTPTGTAGGDDSYTIEGVQLEVGTQATAFSTAGGSYGAELALCQRYYYQVTGASGNNYEGFATGVADASTSADVIAPLPVTMRSVPTTSFAGNIVIYDGGVTPFLSSVANVYGGKTGIYLNLTTGSGLTVGRGVICYTNNATTNNFAFSAEL